MFRQINATDIKGKTVGGCAFWEAGIIVSFTDKTFVYLQAERWGDYAELTDTQEFNPIGYRLDLVLEPAFGEDAVEILQTAKTQRDKREMLKEARRREERLKQYNALKKEFEDR